MGVWGVGCVSFGLVMSSDFFNLGKISGNQWKKRRKRREIIGKLVEPGFELAQEKINCASSLEGILQIMLGETGRRRKVRIDLELVFK